MRRDAPAAAGLRGLPPADVQDRRRRGQPRRRPRRPRPRRSRWGRRTSARISSLRALLQRARRPRRGHRPPARGPGPRAQRSPTRGILLGRALAEKGQLDEAARLLGATATADRRTARARPPSWATSWPSRASSRRPSRATVAPSPSIPARRRRTPISARPWPRRRRVGRSHHPLRDRAPRRGRRTPSSTTGWGWPCARRAGRTRRSSISAKPCGWRPVWPWRTSTSAARSSSKGKLDEAVPHYRRALRPRPAAWPPPTTAWAASWARRAGCAEAIREFRAALRLQPDNEEAHNNLGLALRMTGERDQALAEFTAALARRAGLAGSP